MNHIRYRIRRYNAAIEDYDVLFPQTITSNVLRRDGSGVLEEYLTRYDRHLVDSFRHMVHATSEGDHWLFRVNVPGTVLSDGLPLIMTLHTNMEANAKISFNDGDPKPIVNASGDEVAGGQIEGSAIFVVWSEALDSWVMVSTEEFNDTTKVYIPSMSNYTYVIQADGERTVVIPGYDRKTDLLTVNYGQTILRQGYDYTFAENSESAITLTFDPVEGDILFFEITTYTPVRRPGTVTYSLEVKDMAVTVAADGDRIIRTPPEAINANHFDVNYGQTILRNGLDYVVSTDRSYIILTGDPDDDDEEKSRKSRYYLVNAKEAIGLDDDTADMFVFTDLNGTVDPSARLENMYLSGHQEPIVDEETEDFWTRAGDIVVFRCYVMKETYDRKAIHAPGIVGGNYRYELKVLHESYTSTTGDERTIPVPNYDRNHDELMVVRQNLVLMRDIDYTVDVLNQVLLLGDPLLPGESIYFTIMRGAMVDVPPFHAVEARGDSAQHLLVDLPDRAMVDKTTLIVKLRHDLANAPTLKCIDGPARPIVDCKNRPVPAGYRANSYLWLIFDEPRNTWYSLGHGQVDAYEYPVYRSKEGDANFIGQSGLTNPDPSSVSEVEILHGLGVKPASIVIRPCEAPGMDESGNMKTVGDVWSYADETTLYVGNSGNSTCRFHWAVSTADDSTDLKTYINNRINDVETMPGKLDLRSVVYEAQGDGITHVTVAGFNVLGELIVSVNYGQTVLREGIDYEVTNDGVRLLTMSLSEGDILQFVIANQERA